MKNVTLILACFVFGCTARPAVIGPNETCGAVSHPSLQISYWMTTGPDCKLFVVIRSRGDAEITRSSFDAVESGTCSLDKDGVTTISDFSSELIGNKSIQEFILEKEKVSGLNNE